MVRAISLLVLAALVLLAKADDGGYDQVRRTPLLYSMSHHSVQRGLDSALLPSILLSEPDAVL